MDSVTREREWLELVADLLAAPLGELPEERISEQLQVTFGLLATAYHHREFGRTVQRMWPPDEQFSGHRTEIDHWAVHCAPSGGAGVFLVRTAVRQGLGVP